MQTRLVDRSDYCRHFEEKVTDAVPHRNVSTRKAHTSVSVTLVMKRQSMMNAPIVTSAQQTVTIAKTVLSVSTRWAHTNVSVTKDTLTMV